MRFQQLLGVLSLLAAVPTPTLASVLAIDFGNDWIKASIVKPGIPFDVLLNKDSKRKIQSTVGWKKDDRLFGADGFNVAGRFPQDSFSSVKSLLAAPYESEAAHYYAKISTADIVQTSRQTVAFKRPEGSIWTVEELVAMQFSYVKDLAEALAEEKVHDVIVTVPPYYSQFERDAIADAIEISGLRTLALINDGTAVAVNYAMTRTFPTPEYHVIYDAGASSIRATVVAFTTIPSEAKSNPGGTHISVAGVGYDRKVGGVELDRRLRDILVSKFNAKHGRDVRTDKRGMAKLWKETARVKAVLSANLDGFATAESLAWDLDFKAKVTRTEFESACNDLKPRFTFPIHDALKNAGLTLDNITSVILTGGVTRTPMVQAAVRAAVGSDKIALNVNSDEAAVLGAALYGAGLSRQFKTKDIKVSDITVHPIQVTYGAAAPSENARVRSISTVIFPAGSKVGSKKQLTFKRKEDFSLFLDYKTEIAPGYPTHILEASIGGIAEALANLTARGAVDPVVKATIFLSESGFVSVKDAIAFGEIKETLAAKLKALFVATTSTEETSTSDPPRETPSSEAAAVPSPETTQLKPTTIPLTIETRFAKIPPMTVADKKEARAKLRVMDHEEAAKTRREDARNTLEGYLYRLRDLLDEDQNQDTPFRKCSKEEERDAIAERLQSSFEWIADKADYAETSQFFDKRNALESLERPIVHRYKEIEAFPQALNNSQMWNWSTHLFLNDARANFTSDVAADIPTKWTWAELDGLEKELKDHEKWLDEWVEKQKSVQMNEDPVIDTTEMKARAKTLENHLQKLYRRKAPKAKPKPKPKKEKKVEEEKIEEEPVKEKADAPVPPVDDDVIHDEL